MIARIEVNGEKQKYTLNLNTVDVITHSLMSDYPEVWKDIENTVRTKLETLIKLNDMARFSN